jgi:hypothetical protein
MRDEWTAMSDTLWTEVSVYIYKIGGRQRRVLAQTSPLAVTVALNRINPVQGFLFL